MATKTKFLNKIWWSLWQFIRNYVYKIYSDLFGFDISLVRCLGGYFFLDTVYKAKNCILGHIWPHRDLDPSPFDPQIWRVHPCPMPISPLWRKFGQVPSTNTQDILLTMFVRDSRMHARMAAQTHNASSHYAGRGIKISTNYTSKPARTDEYQPVSVWFPAGNRDYDCGRGRVQCDGSD